MSGHPAEQLPAELPLPHTCSWGLRKQPRCEEADSRHQQHKAEEATDDILGLPSSSGLLIWIFIHFTEPL